MISTLSVKDTTPISKKPAESVTNTSGTHSEPLATTWNDLEQDYSDSASEEYDDDIYDLEDLSSGGALREGSHAETRRSDEALPWVAFWS